MFGTLLTWLYQGGVVALVGIEVSREFQIEQVFAQIECLAGGRNYFPLLTNVPGILYEVFKKYVRL